jgi:hypothetical protein
MIALGLQNQAGSEQVKMNILAFGRSPASGFDLRKAAISIALP